jgi:hypothetical protein
VDDSASAYVDVDDDGRVEGKLAFRRSVASSMRPERMHVWTSKPQDETVSTWQGKSMTSPEVSLAQDIFGDAGVVFLSTWTTNFIAVCVEVSYGTVSCKGCCCARITTLDEIVKDEGTLSTEGRRWGWGKTQREDV